MAEVTEQHICGNEPWTAEQKTTNTHVQIQLCQVHRKQSGGFSWVQRTAPSGMPCSTDLNSLREIMMDWRAVGRDIVNLGGVPKTIGTPLVPIAAACSVIKLKLFRVNQRPDDVFEPTPRVLCMTL